MLQLFFVDHHLCGCASALERTDIVGLVTATLTSVCGSERLADSRWLTVGPSVPAMVAASLTGLQGFLRLGASTCMTLSVTVALCSAVSDTASVKLVVEENRLAMHVTKINGLFAPRCSECPELESLLLGGLSTFTSLGLGELRSKCLRGQHCRHGGVQF